MLAIMAGSALWFGILALMVGAARRYADRWPWVFRGVGLASGLALLAFAISFAWQGIDLLAANMEGDLVTPGRTDL